MTWISRLKWVVASAALLLVFGCIELTGQRISMRYDQARDQLLFLFHYDGIHNNKAEDQESAEKKLRDFVANRDIVLFDWFGHIQREELSRDAASDTTPPNLKALLERVLKTTRVTNLGHYRDTRGRIGAAQLIVIDQASQLVAAANAAISEAILEHTGGTDDGRWDRMLARWKQRAAQGFEWLRLEGHSIVFEFPVERRDWTTIKTSFFEEFEGKADAKESDRAALRLFVRFFASFPLSIDQDAERAVIRFGEARAPWTMRCEWRDDYLPNVERVVTDLVPSPLDQQIAAAVLEEADAGEDLRELLRWGPPEDRVRAVVAAARDDDAGRRERAVRWLTRFAADWNAAGRSPVAPAPGEALPHYLLEWETWYRDLLSQP